MGYDYAGQYESAKHNMLSAKENPEVAQGSLEDKCSKRCVLGPFPPQAVLEVHISRFGVIPKKGVNKWCLILDLSSPDGSSVNDPHLMQLLRSLFFVMAHLEISLRAYRSGGARYHHICLQVALTCLQVALTPYPVTEDTLLLFMVKSYLAAVRYEQIRQGMGDPAIHSMPQLGYVLKKATPASSKHR